ncbi:MAG: radical SAM protein [Planctomycetaceae bacterium]|nr:radical SAM protein [Planctomycetaceae bacterium]
MPHAGHGGGSGTQRHLPRLIAWEVTRSCLLACKHCRAAAQRGPYEGELSTQECRQLLDNIASFAKPIIILTGGEPMLREDIYDIAAYACSLGLRTVMAPCGALLDDASARRILDCGVRHISISLDGATAQSHDAFRGIPGAFDSALRGAAAARRQGLAFQINTTITQHNLRELPQILDLAVSLGAEVFNPFLLVPTGRGKALAAMEITPEDYERTLHWLARRQRSDIAIRVTCAPHYQRIVRQLGLHQGGAHAAKGCMGGQQFAFISHRGKVQICGFLDVECGDVRAEGFDFRRIWQTSPVFLQMRDPHAYHGRCGACEFANVCGGCRARAHAISGDYLGEEPFCTHQPQARPPAARDAIDDALLDLIQTDLPIAPRPYDVLGDSLGLDGREVLRRVEALQTSGAIRRLGAVFDSRSLGYVSTLVAARVPPPRLDDVAAEVNLLPGVTHNYQRQHDYNLWFTLTSPSPADQEKTLRDLADRTGVEAFYPLPALTLYKIRVDFRMVEAASEHPPAPAPPAAAPAALDEPRRRLVRLLQESLPMTAEPFAHLAEAMGWPVQQVLEQIAAWRRQGVIRRFGAVVDHRRLGFNANAMAVLRVPPEQIDSLACRIARRQEVSHCYRRPPLPGFDYSLYAMVHGRCEDDVRRVVGEILKDVGDWPHEVLFSARQFKKVSMRYFL